MFILITVPISSSVLQGRVSLDKCQDEKSAKCSENFLINPKASSIVHNSVLASKQEKTSEEQKKDDEKKLKNTVSTGSTSSNIISVTPQSINITLRPSTFPLTSLIFFHLAIISG